MPRSCLTAALTLGILPLSATPTAAQTPTATAKPYQEEWVYRVKYGFHDEWWHLFQTYQIAALHEEKRRG